MSEPNVIHESWSVEQVKYTDRGSSLEMIAVVPQVVEQLEICLEPLAGGNGLAADVPEPPTLTTLQGEPDPDRQRAREEQEQTALLAELQQARSLIHHYGERIRHLEQALDQSQASLKELRLQMVDQQFLENQLASTEEISNIQQQAINRLKLQLTEQREMLEAQLNQTQVRDLTFHDLLATMETLTQTQQEELEHMRGQLVHDRTQVQTQRQSLETHLADLQMTCDLQQQQILKLESQVLLARTQVGELEIRLEQSQAQVGELTQNLGDRQSTIDRLGSELKKAHLTIEQQPTLILDAPPGRGTRKATGTVRELAIAQGKVDELETEIARQLTSQAMLHQACQELEQERERQQARISDLESKTADMQEQILSQAQQASEYETAIQHLKDRHLNTQSHVLRLKELLTEAIPGLSPELSAVLAELQMATSVAELASPGTVAQPSRPPKVDLPEFLLRRRSYKARQA